MPQPDLTPATTELARIVTGVGDDQLDRRTPCPDWSVADLLDHLDSLAEAFACSARKEPTSDQPPMPDGSRLHPGWRERIPERLGALARAWADPSAWEGRTRIAGVEQTGAECAATAYDEVVVHTWDLARSTGQACLLDPEAVTVATGFARSVAEAAPDGVPGLFGPAGAVPAGASDPERLLRLTGRDPAWMPPSR